MLNGADPLNTDSSQALTRLVLVGGCAILLRWVSLLKDEQAIVAKISEVKTESFEEFVFLVLEEVFILLNKLSDDISEQGKSVWQVLHVVISLTADAHDLFENGFLGKQLEAVLVLTEFLKDSVGVEGHLVVILILGRKLVDEIVDNEGSLFLENRLHVFLLCSEFTFTLVVIVQVAAFACFPSDACFVLLVLVWLNLNFEKRNEK